MKYITPKRIWVYIRSKIRKIIAYRLNERDAILFSEVMLYKALSCPDCVQMGKCKKCHCPIPELFTSMDVGCSLGHYPQFEVNRDWNLIWRKIKDQKFKEAWEEFKRKRRWQEEWKKYKEENNVFFTKFYG
ncbi:MAG: hypothetical protein J5I47_07695 [Vicingus serpentipes]|nr:hypothetical protein [Vicingus serpentipes]